MDMTTHTPARSHLRTCNRLERGGQLLMSTWLKSVQRVELPITPPILCRMKIVWERMPCRKDASMLWAASCLCFFGFLRMGEAVVPSDTEFNPMVHLTYQDVQAESTSQPKWIRVRIKASKTDPFRVGVTIYVGATGKWLDRKSVV